jgi:hypothetical protein
MEPLRTRRLASSHLQTVNEWEPARLNRKTVNTTLPSVGDQPFAGTGRIYFLGLIHGHWDLAKDLSIAQAEAVNMGISIIVPAHKIWEVVNQPELKEQRTKYDIEVGKGILRTQESNPPQSQ